MSFLETLGGVIQRAASQFRGNQSGNAPVLLMLGGFKFSLNTAVFLDMNRSSSYRWAMQERIGRHDALQFTGFGEDRITLPGVVYPDFRGGKGQITDLRSLASEGRPLRMIASGGEVLGLWVIESVEETQSSFKPDGGFRKQEFTVSLRRFGDDENL